MKKDKTLEEELEEIIEVSKNANMHRDFSFKEHEDMEIKTDLVIEISKAIKKEKLTQLQVSKMIGIPQQKLSELLGGKSSHYSVERLIHILNELGEDVDIVVKSRPSNRRARVCVYGSNGKSPSNSSMVS